MKVILISSCAKSCAVSNAVVVSCSMRLLIHLVRIAEFHVWNIAQPLAWFQCLSWT